MKKFLAILLSLLMLSTMLVGLMLPASADTSATYIATFESKTYKATPANASGARVYNLTIDPTAPADVLAKVTYTVDGKPFNGASEPGTYTITAHLPKGFVDANGKAVSEISATLTLVRIDQNFAALVFDANGNETDTFAEPKTATVPAKLLKKSAFKVVAFDLKNGVAGQKYMLRISTYSDLYATKNLTQKSIYLYEGDKLVSLTSKGYKVELKDGYYEITGVESDAQMTLVIKVNQCVFPWWIIIIILIVLLLVCMYLVGRAKTKREEEAEEIAKAMETAKAKEAAAQAEAQQAQNEEKPAEPTDETPKNE